VKFLNVPGVKNNEKVCIEQFLFEAKTVHIWKYIYFEVIDVVTFVPF